MRQRFHLKSSARQLFKGAKRAGGGGSDVKKKFVSQLRAHSSNTYTRNIIIQVFLNYRLL